MDTRKGDIPETDQELEKMLNKKAVKQPKVVRKNFQGAVVAEPKPVVLDGNQEVVTDEKLKKALLRSEKTKAAKSTPAPKTPKPKAEKPVKVKAAANPSGHAWITAQMVVDVFADAETMKYSEIATKHNISVGSVSTILSGPKWFVDRFTPRLAEIGITAYPQRAKKEATAKAPKSDK